MNEPNGRANLQLEANEALTARSAVSGHAFDALEAKRKMTARNDSAEHAEPALKAKPVVTARPNPRPQRARQPMEAAPPMTAPDGDDICDRIAFEYRLAKTAEDTRNRLQLGITAFVRTYYSGWEPAGDMAERKARAAAAKRVVKHVLRAMRPTDKDGKALLPFPEVLTGVPPLEPGDVDIREKAGAIIADMAAPWWRFEIERHRHRKEAEKMAMSLPVFARIRHIAGFSAWGLVAIIGEAGDLSNYSGCRKLYKRLGLAPDDCYPTGQRRPGRKIPRLTRGRIMGIIAESLLRAQWRGAQEGNGGGGECLAVCESQAVHDLAAATVPAHAIGPYGEVYGEAKVLHLAAGKVKGHADKIARRAMVKALLHDVHRAWHGRDLHYAGEPRAEWKPSGA